MGFSQIFLISLFSRLKLFFIAAIIFFLFAILNLWISSKSKKNIVSFKFKLSLVSVLSILAGLMASSGWFKVLQYLNQTAFSIQDPIFSKDVAFYVFTLPFYSFVWTFLMGCVITTTIMVLLDYLQVLIIEAKKRENVMPGVPLPAFDFKGIFSKIKTKALAHLGILVSLIFILMAVSHYLSRFSIMYCRSFIRIE